MYVPASGTTQVRKRFTGQTKKIYSEISWETCQKAATQSQRALRFPCGVITAGCIVFGDEKNFAPSCCL